MDLSAMSISLSTLKVANAVQVSLLKKTMDTLEENGSRMTQMMEMSVHPNLGNAVDIRG